MAGKSKFVLLMYFCIFSVITSNAQQDFNQSKIEDTATFFTDTIMSFSREYSLIHYHNISAKYKKSIILDSNNSIFNVDSNKYSRLIFSDRFHSFNIPTVPLTHLVLLKSQGLILGLSNITIAPYNVVIYTLDGYLIFKCSLNAFELKANITQLKSLIKTYPELLATIKQSTIVKENDYYYIEVNPTLINIIGRENLRNLDVLSMSHYFPYVSFTSDSQENKYSRYNDYFSETDPYYELISVGSVPYLLVLNTGDGKKVHIPLVSNCNIIDELKKK